MHSSEVFFEKQRAVISQHLKDAKSFIIVAMAWFTDKTLFDLLDSKSKEGLQVYVVIHDDEINSGSEINYGTLNRINSDVVLISDEKKLMHHKFCVIDGTIVLHGSYNWTYQAVNNHENLTVTTGDIELAATFTKQFYKIRKSYLLSMLPSNGDEINSEISPVVSATRSSRGRRAGIIKRMQEKQAAINNLKVNPKTDTQ